jgi:SAM-dependent methyltransferase
VTSSPPPDPPVDGPATAEPEYAERLRRLDESAWRRFFNVQAPYRWNIRRLRLGRALDIGCGLGRNLAYLDSSSVGVDHNAQAIAIARSRGLQAYTVEDFVQSPLARPGSFDSLLVAHVVEHMSEPAGIALLRDYLPYLKPGGRVCLITPQELGYRTDSTHVRFVDHDDLVALVTGLGLRVSRRFSFPFPRLAGKFFPYNEFVLIAEQAS